MESHIAIVPSPGISHLIPILELSKRLVRLHQHFHIRFLIPPLGPPSNSTKSLLQPLPPNMDSIFLPQVTLDDLPQGTPYAVQIVLTISRSLPHLRDALRSLTSTAPIAALIADPFSSDALDVAQEFNIPHYLFYPSSVMSLSLCLRLPELEEAVTGEFGDMDEPVQVPGCVSVHGRDFPEPVRTRSSEASGAFIYLCKRLPRAKGFLVNSFTEMEGDAIKGLREDYPPVYAVGPIVQSDSGIQLRGSECLRWLDNREPKTVIYVSFGSGGTLSEAQLRELALGLELSGQNFLWVVRVPSDSPNAEYLKSQNEQDPLQFLPEGFLGRTKDRGFVVPSWAPQIQVLGHRATGGFITHCGWSSALEGLVHGVPLIAWPLFAEQKMNALMLSDGLKVALRPKANGKGIVETEEIADVVKSLMEGEDGKGIRRRIDDLKEAAANAIGECGSSTMTLSELAEKWKV